MKPLLSFLVTYCFFLNPGNAQSVATSGKSEISYYTVTIGNQVWMDKNLDVDRFRNGDLIPEAKTAEEWKQAGENKQPAWCYYDSDPVNVKNYGKLYNWYAVNDSRGLAPEGWHVPSKVEWSNLIDFLGEKNFTGKDMKSVAGWQENGNGTNSIGFTGLPAGGRLSRGVFGGIGAYGIWWSSSEFSLDDSWSLLLNKSNSNVERDLASKRKGLSVRCLRD